MPVSQASAYDQQHLEMIAHGCHWMINIEIRLIIFFAAKDGEALYSKPKKKKKKKKDQEFNCSSNHELLSANSDLN